MSLFDYPKEKCPRTLLGYAKGKWRWERVKEYYRPDLPSEGYTDGGWLVNDQNEFWGIVTQQYESKYGFSILWPLGINVWYQFRKQKDRKPGSEFVIYRRLALWRWDAEGTDGKHWMGPWSIYFNFSTHWD